jgi:hypothetical protein
LPPRTAARISPATTAAAANITLPDQPNLQLALMLPGPPAYDDATAAQIRELVAKGGASVA